MRVTDDVIEHFVDKDVTYTIGDHSIVISPGLGTVYVATSDNDQAVFHFRKEYATHLEIKPSTMIGRAEAQPDSYFIAALTGLAKLQAEQVIANHV